MASKKLMLLWGSSGAYGDDRSGAANEYREALDLIEQGAGVYGFRTILLQYPGQPDKRGITEGKLSFCAALLRVLQGCTKIEPDWIIGRSLGALLAPAALSCGGDWVKSCKGAVMWGPGFKTYMNEQWPDAQSKAAVIEDYKKFQTHLASDFFDTLPEVETLVSGAACNLRFARGSKDKYNSKEDLQTLEAIHSTSQPAFKREVVEIKGVDHTPTPKKLSSEKLKQYFDCLFVESMTTRRP